MSGIEVASGELVKDLGRSASVSGSAVMPGYVFMVVNRTTTAIFKSREGADNFVSQFSAAVAGGMSVIKFPVFGRVIWFLLICSIVFSTSIEVQGSGLIDQAVLCGSFETKNISVFNTAIDENSRLSLENGVEFLRGQVLFFRNRVAHIAVRANNTAANGAIVNPIGHRVGRWDVIDVNVVVNNYTQSGGFPRIAKNNLSGDWLSFFDYGKLGTFDRYPCTSSNYHLVSNNPKRQYSGNSDYTLDVMGNCFSIEKRTLGQYLGYFCVFWGVVFWFLTFHIVYLSSCSLNIRGCMSIFGLPISIALLIYGSGLCCSFFYI